MYDMIVIYERGVDRESRAAQKLLDHIKKHRVGNPLLVELRSAPDYFLVHDGGSLVVTGIIDSHQSALAQLKKQFDQIRRQQAYCFWLRVVSNTLRLTKGKYESQYARMEVMWAMYHQMVVQLLRDVYKNRDERLTHN